MWRWTRWRDLGWDVHEEELIIFVVRDLTDSLLCVFPCSNNSCLCLSVDRWQVMMVFSSVFLIVYFFLILLFVELTFPCCFSRSKSPKGWSTGNNIFWLFFLLWFWYCVSFPWVSEVEMIYLFILFLLALPWRIQKRKKKHWRHVNTNTNLNSSYKNKLHVYS